jgi:hypothetical protein
MSLETEKLMSQSLAESVIWYNPTLLITEVLKSPNLIIGAFENLFKIFFKTIGLPGEISEEGLSTAMDDWFYTFTRLTFGGAAYRDVRNFFDDYFDFYLSTKQ